MMNNKRVSWLIVVVSALMGSAVALLAVIAVFLFIESDRPLIDRLAVTDQKIEKSNKEKPNKKEVQTEAEENEQVIAWKQMQMLTFNNEQKAPLWSEQTQNQLIERFKLLNDERTQHDFTPFQVDNVECRSSICVVILRWDDIELARDASPAIAMFDYQLPCATSSLIYNDPEQTEEVNYRHEVIFRCKRSVA